MRSLGEKKIKSLTKDNISCLSQAFSGLVEISEHLFQKESFEYVMLSIFFN